MVVDFSVRRTGKMENIKKERTPLQLFGIGMVFGFWLGILTLEFRLVPTVIKSIGEVIALVLGSLGV